MVHRSAYFGVKQLRKDLTEFVKGAMQHYEGIAGSMVFGFFGGLLGHYGLDLSRLTASVCGVSLFFSCSCFVLWRDKQREVECLQQQLAPLFTITCGSDPESILKDDFRATVRLRFLRAKVQTECLDIIRDCHGHLTSIRKGQETLWAGERANLTFAPGWDEDAQKKAISKNLPTFLDVLSISEEDRIQICTKNGEWIFNASKLEEIFSTPGEYLLTVLVVGEAKQNSAWAEVTLIFDWTGNCQTSSLRNLVNTPAQ